MGNGETCCLSRIQRRMQLKAALVESKAMVAADASTAEEPPLTVENVHDAVVKALANERNTEAAFVGMHELERGDEFGLEEHTVFGAIAEGKTADDENSDAEEISEESDTSARREFKPAKLFTNILTVVCIAMAILVNMGAYADEVGSDIVTATRA